MVYKYVYSNDTYNLTGYIDHSLSGKKLLKLISISKIYLKKKFIEFSTAHYVVGSGRTVNAGDPKTCQYRGYRNGPNDKDPYGLSPHYWHVFAARLAFVVVFEVLLINQ